MFVYYKGKTAVLTGLVNIATVDGSQLRLVKADDLQPAPEVIDLGPTKTEEGQWVKVIFNKKDGTLGFEVNGVYPDEIGAFLANAAAIVIHDKPFASKDPGQE